MSKPKMTAETKKLPKILQWMLDTRVLWPEAKKTADLTTHAAKALSRLTNAEHTSVLRYFHVKDAKLSLCSHLLKHYVISKYGGLGPTKWDEGIITHNDKRKPVFLNPYTKTQPVVFNVSHQAGLVALVAAYYEDGSDASGIDLGVDVVCVSERDARDRQMIAEQGWNGFVDVHAEVLAPSEVVYLKTGITMDPFIAITSDAERLHSMRIRSFYTLWCLREAYVKMTGEALLAEWLRELEFKAFRAPQPEVLEWEEGEAHDVDAFRLWFKGKEVTDTQIQMCANEEGYMWCTAVRTKEDNDVGLGVKLDQFRWLKLDEVLDFAESKA